LRSDGGLLGGNLCRKPQLVPAAPVAALLFDGESRYWSDCPCSTTGLHAT